MYSLIYTGDVTWDVTGVDGGQSGRDLEGGCNTMREPRLTAALPTVPRRARTAHARPDTTVIRFWSSICGAQFNRCSTSESAIFIHMVFFFG